MKPFKMIAEKPFKIHPSIEKDKRKFFGSLNKFMNALMRIKFI